MANEISTAGILLKYAVETTAGTRPTTGFTQIPNVKSIPEFNAEPSNLEVTDLSDTVWKRYIPGLKDIGGAISITVNFNDTFKTAWETMMSAYTTAKGSNKATWFEYSIPGMDSFYFSGELSELGFVGADVDSVFEGSVYITPNTIAGFAAAST